MDNLTIIKGILDKVCEDNIYFNMFVGDNLFKTYDDSSGQRKCRLEHFGYGEPNTDKNNLIYKIRRVLVFENKEDKGKADAVIGTISIHDLPSDVKLNITNQRLEINNMALHFYENIL